MPEGLFRQGRRRRICIEIMKFFKEPVFPVFLLLPPFRAQTFSSALFSQTFKIYTFLLEPDEVLYP
jgi:hypothetical protein